jgi:hypothetical protein
MRYSVKLQTRLFGIILFAAASNLGAQSSNNDGSKTQILGYWIDPSTGLMWAGKDNRKDVSWRGAVKYCRNLRLAGYSDWRLANMFELQPIYDKTAESPGLAGPGNGRATQWHVKGNLFLTGNQWANNSRNDGHSSGYEYYFDFNEGRSNDEPTGWPYPFSFKRALCIRGSGDPLGGQRQH